ARSKENISLSIRYNERTEIGTVTGYSVLQAAETRGHTERARAPVFFGGDIGRSTKPRNKQELPVINCPQIDADLPICLTTHCAGFAHCRLTCIPYPRPIPFCSYCST